VSDGDPSDDVLLELGRMTWAAMALEETAYLICRTITPRTFLADRPIGQRVDEALTACREEELRERARAWLLEALGALAGRNHVLHSTHIAFVSMPGTEPLLTAGETSRTSHARRRAPSSGGRSRHRSPSPGCNQ
jgi:hypothetical protein